MGKPRFVLIVVGAYLWVMLILFGSIVLETFMVYPNIFHDPPASLATSLEFMRIRAPSNFYPPLGFLSWLLGAASVIAAWRTPAAPLFDASISPDVPAELLPPRPLGLDGNFFSVLVVTPVILIGWLFARRGAARTDDR
jgi:hypothetical protein